jgi:hypothetical protein
MFKELKLTATRVYAAMLFTLAAMATASANESFYTQIQSYAGASVPVEIVVSESFTLDRLVSVPAPASGSGATLTIRSANPAAPVTLTRGIAGNLFTLASGRALVLRDIIIDGGRNGGFADNGGGALVWINGGTLAVNDGAVLRNNTHTGDGGGVDVRGGGTFTMNNGEISGNTGRDGGAVNVTGANSRFTMSGGKISDNVATREGGGVAVYATQQGGFTMTGGEITDNTALRGGGIHKTNNGELTLGGTAVVVDNTNTRSGNVFNVSNVNLPNNQYVTISSTTPPATGMNVGIWKTTNSGIFVQSGAAAGQEQYFRDDVAGRAIGFYDGALMIGGSRFHYQVAAYETAQSDLVIVVEQNLTLDELVAVPENANGATLTIRSANPNAPVILTRGISGDLFTLRNRAALILENIIIDGGRNGDFADNGGGALVEAINGGTFTMNNGAVLRNNVRAGGGGGVRVSGIRTGTFTMAGGEISNNTASHGGGVYVSGDSSTFTMIGGEITGNTSREFGCGVYVAQGMFIMTGGKISNNFYDGVVVSGGGSLNSMTTGTFVMGGGEISGHIEGNIRRRTQFFRELYTITINPTVVIWNKPAAGGPFAYDEGSSNDLSVTPPAATALWSITNGVHGVSYQNGNSTGFAELPVTVIRHPFIAQVMSYAVATEDVEIVVGESFTLDARVNVNVPTPKTAGITLTIRSANPTAPVTITRGRLGVFFTIHENATLILENIIIDGGRAGNFANSGGGVLAIITNGGTLTTNAGAILRNNAAPGGVGGVSVTSGGRFTMRGGEISGHSGAAGGVYVDGGDFTMIGGEITDNTGTRTAGVDMQNGVFTMRDGKIANNTAPGGGGVRVLDGAFTMTGGEISGNTANGNSGITHGGGGVIITGGLFIMSGGEITGNTAANNFGGGVFISGGTSTEGTFIRAGGEISGNIGGDIIRFTGRPTIIVTWDKPADDGPFNYTAGTSTALTALPADIASAVWAVNSGTLGISYTHGANIGFIPINAMVPVSILSTDRVIPDVDVVDNVAVVVPVNKMTAQFTAGPNPVSRSSGVINFFWQGRQIDNASLTIFDASGNVVNTISIPSCMGNRPRSPATSESTTTVNTQDRRLIGTWNLTDTKGRPVSEGTYLARGVVTMLDGKRERVSVIIGVR